MPINPGRTVLMLAISFGLTGAATAQQNPTPPADAPTWVLSSGDKTFGEAKCWVDPQGARLSVQTLSLRGQLSELHQTLRSTADGKMSLFEIHGDSNGRSVAETFTWTPAGYEFHAGGDSGAAAAPHGLFYIPLTATVDATAALAEALLEEPTHRLTLAPSG